MCLQVQRKLIAFKKAGILIIKHISFYFAIITIHNWTDASEPQCELPRNGIVYNAKEYTADYRWLQQIMPSVTLPFIFMLTQLHFYSHDLHGLIKTVLLTICHLQIETKICGQQQHKTDQS